jgi:hypothetical protein
MPLAARIVGDCARCRFRSDREIRLRWYDRASSRHRMIEMPGFTDGELCGRLGCSDRQLISHDRFYVLQQLASLKSRPEKMIRLRMLLDRQQSAVSRIPDDIVLAQIANMLTSGRLHLHQRAETDKIASNTPIGGSRSEAVAPPAPAGRPRPPAAVNQPPIVPDTPTFPPNTNFAAQAAVLVAAARAGAPMCAI